MSQRRRGLWGTWGCLAGAVRVPKCERTHDAKPANPAKRSFPPPPIARGGSRRRLVTPLAVVFVPRPRDIPTLAPCACAGPHSRKSQRVGAIGVADRALKPDCPASGGTLAASEAKGPHAFVIEFDHQGPFRLLALRPVGQEPHRFAWPCLSA